jgi:glycosyltransferase involved in cell wall biosynthesis
MNREVNIFMSKHRCIFIVGTRVLGYPRNRTLTQAFEVLGRTIITEITSSVAAQGQFAWNIFRLAHKEDILVVMYPAEKLPVLVVLARCFFPGIVINDTLISSYDSWVNDRALVAPIGVKALYYHALDQLLCWCGDILMFDTKEDEEYFCKRYFIRVKTKTLVIPIAIDLTEVDAVLPAYPNEIPDASNCFTIFFLGNYIPLQGVGYILHAIALIPHRERFRFLMVGNGQTRPMALRLAQKLGLSDVEFTKRLPYATAIALTKQVDLALGIFGDTDKAQRVVPNKILEAMAARTPVVTGRSPAVGHYFKDGEEVYYCTMGDAQSLADAILRAYADRKNHKVMCAAARDVIEREFSVPALKEILRGCATNALRITFLLPHLKVSGGVRVLFIYASLLAARGHQVTICVRSQSPLRRFLGNLLRGAPRWFPELHGARIVRVAMFTEKDLPDADVIIASPVGTALDSARLSPSKGRKFYFIQHDEGLYHTQRERANESYQLPLVKIVVSSWLKEILRENHGEDSTLLLNTVDHVQFHPVPEAKQNDGLLRVLLLAHPYEWKGTKEGVAIVETIKKTHTNVRLMLFGSRTEKAALHCDEYYDNVPQEELASIYSRADIFLCPSWDEGFGLPALEAMACGTAVVTYDNGGSRDFAFHEKTALVAPRRNTKRLGEELTRLVEDTALRERIARGGREFIMTMPTWREQAVKLEKILNAR